MKAPRSIIVPVGLGPDSNQLVSLAAAVAVGIHAELILAGIAPLAALPRTTAQAGDLTLLADDADQRLIDLLVRERLDEVSAGLPEGVQARTLLTWGSLPVALTAAAKEERAELIVVGMRRGHGISARLHEHADGYVLHHSTVPVLVVPIESPRAGWG